MYNTPTVNVVMNDNSIRIHLPSHKHDESKASIETSVGVRLIGFDVSGFSFTTRFVLCVFVLFGLYIPYGYIQESIFKVDGFTFALYITFIQFLLYTLFSLTEGFVLQDTNIRAPLHEYFRLSLFLVISLALSNKAIVYLNYPTKVVLKSSKLIPMMLMGRVWFGKLYIKAQYLATILLLIGICLFSLADFSVSDTSTMNFHVQGIVFMVLSITAEALGQHFQEGVIAKYNCTEREMVFANSIIGTGILAIFLVLTGEISAAFDYCVKYPHIYLKIGLLSVLGYLGALTVLTLIKTYGLFIAMSVANARKLFTIILSFMLFPKPFSFIYVVASVFAFAGIGLNIYIKNKEEFHELMGNLFRRRIKGPPDLDKDLQTEETTSMSRGD